LCAVPISSECMGQLCCPRTSISPTHEMPSILTSLIHTPTITCMNS
jgi:hypothetical protein